MEGRHRRGKVNLRLRKWTTKEGEPETTGRSKSTSSELDSEDLYDDPPVTEGNQDAILISESDSDVEVEAKAKRPPKIKKAKEKSKTKYGTVILILLVIAAGGYFGWKHYELNNDFQTERGKLEKIERDKEEMKAQMDVFENKTDILQSQFEALKKEMDKLNKLEELERKMEKLNKLEGLEEKMEKLNKLEELEEKMEKLNKLEELEAKMKKLIKLEELEIEIQNLESVKSATKNVEYLEDKLNKFENKVNEQEEMKNKILVLENEASEMKQEFTFAKDIVYEPMKSKIMNSWVHEWDKNMVFWKFLPHEFTFPFEVTFILDIDKCDTNSHMIMCVRSSSSPGFSIEKCRRTENCPHQFEVYGPDKALTETRKKKLYIVMTYFPEKGLKFDIHDFISSDIIKKYDNCARPLTYTPEFCISNSTVNCKESWTIIQISKQDRQPLMTIDNVKIYCK